MANLTSTILLLALLGIPLLSQGRVSLEPILLGPIGNRLTAADRAQITALVAKSGGTPWVMEGTVAYPPDEVRWYVNVYLPPDRETPRLRRGRIVTMTATLPLRGSDAMEKTWRAASTSEYGQVPVPGGQPDVVSSGRDLNRPFRISVPLTDEQVVSIADFVRTSPAVPKMVGWPNGSRVEGSWPIAALLGDSSKRGALVAVALLGPWEQESSGQQIALGSTNGRWTIIGFGLFVSG